MTKTDDEKPDVYQFKDDLQDTESTVMLEANSGVLSYMIMFR